MPDVPPKPNAYCAYMQCNACGSVVVLMEPTRELYEYLNTWIYHHRCERKVSQVFARFLGQPCVICEGLIDNIFTVRSVDSRPIHRGCRRCLVCKKLTPDSMVGSEYYRLTREIPRGPYHRDCLEEAYGAWMDPKNLRKNRKQKYEEEQVRRAEEHARATEPRAPAVLPRSVGREEI